MARTDFNETTLHELHRIAQRSYERANEPTLTDEHCFVNGKTSCDGLIQYLGRATRMSDGTWRCYAITPVGLAIVEVKISFMLVDHDPGDEDPRARS